MPLFGPPNIEKLVEKRDVSGLVRALRYKDPETRYRAAAALGKLADPRAVEPLCSALKDADADVRNSAAVSLRYLGDRRAVKPLCAALNDERADVRLPAAAALGELGDLLAVGPLILALQDDNEWVRREAAAALARIAGPKALEKVQDHRAEELLIEALSDENIDVAVSAMFYLGQLGHVRSNELLIAALNHEHWLVRKRAAEGLRAAGGVAWDARTLVGAEQGQAVTKAVELALGALREQTVQALVAALADENLDVRLEVIVSLGQLGDPSAVAPLIALLERGEPFVSGWAAHALERIGGSEVETALAEYRSRQGGQ